MPTVRVCLFARFRDLVGADDLQVPLSDGATVHDLRTSITNLDARLAPLLARSQIAVNHEFASDDAEIHSNDEIALIPPVSGG